MKKHCDYHLDDPYEAETRITAFGITYVVLRCPRCGRTRGERLVRKVRVP